VIELFSSSDYLFLTFSKLRFSSLIFPESELMTEVFAFSFFKLMINIIPIVIIRIKRKAIMKTLKKYFFFYFFLF